MKAVVAAFNQEKALGRGLLRDYEPSDGTFWSTSHYTCHHHHAAGGHRHGGAENNHIRHPPKMKFVNLTADSSALTDGWCCILSLILWDLPFVLFNQVSTILSTTQGWFEHIFYFMYFISKCVLLFTKISESHKNRTDTLYTMTVRWWWYIWPFLVCQVRAVFICTLGGSVLFHFTWKMSDIMTMTCDCLIGSIDDDVWRY